MNYIYKSLSCALCILILLGCVYYETLGVLSVYDFILSFILIICVYAMTMSKSNKIAKLCVVLLVSAVCHFQFFNLNVDIKYSCGNISQDVKRLYILHGERCAAESELRP